MITVDVNKSYTYADYLKWSFEEQVELIRGKIFPMIPAPARRHQQVSRNLGRQLDRFLEPKKSCELYYAPFDVRLPKLGNTKDEEVVNVVQPDICVVCDPFKLDDRGCLGAPDLTIEILSPSTSEKDLTHKYSLYEEAGVKEYWTVFPFEEIVQVYVLNSNGKYNPSITYTRSQKVPVHIFNGELVVDLEKVFNS
ncbi:MAG TPA: restriction endonuclease [Cytophagales bacterium]|nr:restriction endonuclease [Cytophagales bacterium]HAA19882.1 restriction endonuclease [Cytophagales bacterium]HAP63709.1 restriction endonuclease [Cytophagales bacterium]